MTDISVKVASPFEFFTALDGTALEGGKIYIGVAGLDAETNPINVYWDAGLTVAAAQPVRTIAGVPDNGGTPSDFFAGSDYSITVRASDDTLVYSKLSAFEGSDFAEVRVNRSGDGSTTSFTLPFAPTSVDAVTIFIDSNYQSRNSFSVSGTALTFSETPPPGSDNIEILLTAANVAVGQTATSITTSSGDSVQDKIDQAAYPTRALFKADVDALKIWADGDVVNAGPVSFVKSTGATEIPDLLGWLPYGDWTPQHFGEINGTTDSATIQAMWDALTFGQNVYFPPDIVYGIDATIDANISFKKVTAHGARFILSVDGVAFDLNPDADNLDVEGTAKNYGFWYGGQFTSSVVSPTATAALKFYGVRQMAVKDLIIGDLLSSMINGLQISGLGGHDIENNRFIRTAIGINCPAWAAGVSGHITTSVFKNNQFTMTGANKAIFVDCGFNRWTIIGGFANGTTAALFHFTDNENANGLEIIGTGFEQAVSGGKFIHLEDTSANGFNHISLRGVQFNGNPAGGSHTHFAAERVRRMVWSNVRTEAAQDNSNWTLEMDSNCHQFEADSACRFLDFSLNPAAVLNIDAAVDRERIVFPDMKMTTPRVLSGYDGNSFSSTTVTLDMSTLIIGDRYPNHGQPPRGYTLSIQARDSDSTGTAGRMVEAAKSASEPAARRSLIDLDGITNDRRVQETVYVPADTNGDIWLNIVASGASTLDLWVYVLEIHN